jgi:23S rRNA (uracil1939-C5)-methyltransferase
VNTAQAEAVVPLLLEGLGTTPGRLIDAYCGIGTYSLPLARRGWQVEGIEQQAAAVALAQHNAGLNGLESSLRFHCQDVAEFLAARLAEGDPQALLLDPPRKGLAGGVIAAIRAAPPPRLLYLSCDPATLARDLGLLCSEGPYRPVWVQPLDFFPNTSHVECLALLERI